MYGLGRELVRYDGPDEQSHVQLQKIKWEEHMKNRPYLREPVSCVTTASRVGSGKQGWGTALFSYSGNRGHNHWVLGRLGWSPVQTPRERSTAS